MTALLTLELKGSCQQSLCLRTLLCSGPIVYSLKVDNYTGLHASLNTTEMAFDPSLALSCGQSVTAVTSLETKSQSACMACICRIDPIARV